MDWKNFFRKKESETIHDILKKHEAAFTHKPLEIELPHKGNEQLDNFKFNKIPSSSQCGYTVISVVLSELIPEAKDDKFIKEMIEHFEQDFINGKGNRFGSFMNNHVIIYKHYLEKYGINKKPVFVPSQGTIDDVVNALKKGSAVEVSGMMTSSGHFMAITGYSELRKAFKVQDPYKLFDFDKKRYTTKSGLDAWYEIEKFYPYLERSSMSATNKKGIRFLYLDDK